MESNARICKTCKQIKTRTESGRYPNGKDKKYSDETGKLWNGSICPACVVEKSKLTMKKNREGKKVDNGQPS